MIGDIRSFFENDMPHLLLPARTGGCGIVRFNACLARESPFAGGKIQRLSPDGTRVISFAIDIVVIDDFLPRLARSALTNDWL
jgi:hypothetical protein